MNNPFSASQKNPKTKVETAIPPNEESEDSPEVSSNEPSRNTPHHDVPASGVPSEGADPETTQPNAAPLTMEEVSCRSCRFFQFEGEKRSDVLNGECRRLAPSPGRDSVAAWPSVEWNSWCGEWSQGVSHEEMVRMARAMAEKTEDDTVGVEPGLVEGSGENFA